MSYKCFSTYVYRFRITQEAITFIFEKYLAHFGTAIRNILGYIQRLSLGHSNETGTCIRGKNKWRSVSQNNTVCLHNIRSNPKLTLVKNMRDHRFQFWGGDLYSTQRDYGLPAC